MSATKVICFDMDGVLTNFYPGYNAIAKELGLPILEPGRWDDFLNDDVWARIKASGSFWRGLPSHVGGATLDRIDRLNREHSVYFVSNRPGLYAAVQTRVWLEAAGIYRPTVIVSKFKGDVAKAVGATHFIEDKAENAWCVAWLSPGTRSYLLDRPYNQYDPSQFGSKKVTRLFSVEEYLDIVEAA